jgi:hypothetical protein
MVEQAYLSLHEVEEDLDIERSQPVRLGWWLGVWSGEKSMIVWKAQQSDEEPDPAEGLALCRLTAQDHRCKRILRSAHAIVYTYHSIWGVASGHWRRLADTEA